MAAEPASPSGPAMTLSHRHVFGLNAGVKNNIHYVEETQIIYPAGTNTVLWIADEKKQKFFPGNKGSEGISCLAVNVTKRFLAVAEKCVDSAVVTVFDLITTKKKRTLSNPEECDCPEFESVAFCPQNRFLLTMTGTSPSGKHDYTIMWWLWDKARLMDKIQVTNAQKSPVHECSFNPSDNSAAIAIGDGIFKYMQLRDGRIATLPIAPPKQQNFLSHTWLSDDKLLVCCESGELMLFANMGELQATLPCSPKEPKSVTCILSFSKGFVTGGDDGLIRVFEKSDDPKELYRKTKTIPIEGSGNGAGVRSLALSQSEEVLAVTTSTAQLCQLSLLGQDLVKAEESPVFEPVLTHFHTGGILGMDVCTRKPLVVTCGTEKVGSSVRVWNYVEKTGELCKYFNEEAYSVAFHPSGFHLIVGFSDKLRLMNLLMEDMRTYKEITIRACRECRFSNGGQYFAAVSTTSIYVYKTYTCEVIATLKGHNGKVQSIAWTADDSMLVSAGMDGAVYEHVVLAERRLPNDFVVKNTPISCVIVYTDPQTAGNTMYCVATDKMLREVQGGLCQHSVGSNMTLGQIVLSNSAKSLFASVAEPGCPAPIRCYKFPLADGQYDEFSCHSGPATRIRVTFDDYYLFTCAKDGCLFIFDVRKKDRAVGKRDKENVLPPADEILVTTTFLEEKQVQLNELERQVDELSTQIDFQLRHRESQHKEEMVDLEQKYAQEIEQERNKYELLREEKGDKDMENEENIKNLQDLHAKQIADLEAYFQQMLMREVEQYEAKKKERDDIQKQWEMKLRQMIEENKREVADLQRQFEDRESQDKQVIQRYKDEKLTAERIHQETMVQLEQDTDKEIQELKQHKEDKLKEEKDEKVKLRGQSGISKRHHEEARRQMQKRDEELQQYKEEGRKKQERIEQLQKEQEQNKKESKERDQKIGDKEARIYELKKQNQDLEKFKFVYDEKIKELKLSNDPKNDAIFEMKKQIQEMDGELEEYHRKNKQLTLNIEQLQLKQKRLQNDIVKLREKMADCQTVIKRFKNDLHECVQCIQEPKQLKEALVNLYNKYVPNGIKKQELDPDIQREYSRQRAYLEKSVESLKRKLLKDSECRKHDNTRVLQDNVKLIREINDLRKQIDFLKKERQQQRLHVSKRKNEKAPPTMVPAVAEAYSKELEMNKTKILDLRKAIDHQMHLRESYLSAQGTFISPAAETSVDPMAVSSQSVGSV